MKTLVLFYGPPGVGKSSVAKELFNSQVATYISMNDMITKHIQSKAEGYRSIQKSIMKGTLVDDKYLWEGIDVEIRQSTPSILLMDGYPRTRSQLQNLLDHPSISTIVSIHLETDEEIILERLRRRLKCFNCNEEYNKDEVLDNRCPKCSSPLSVRPDDNEQVVKSRYMNYLENSNDLVIGLQEQTNYFFVNASLPRSEVNRLCLQVLTNLGLEVS